MNHTRIAPTSPRQAPHAARHGASTPDHVYVVTEPLAQNRFSRHTLAQEAVRELGRPLVGRERVVFVGPTGNSFATVHGPSCGANFTEMRLEPVRGSRSRRIDASGVRGAVREHLYPEGSSTPVTFL